jgi:hypothetical protein
MRLFVVVVVIYSFISLIVFLKTNFDRFSLLNPSAVNDHSVDFFYSLQINMILMNLKAVKEYNDIYIDILRMFPNSQNRWNIYRCTNFVLYLYQLLYHYLYFREINFIITSKAQIQNMIKFLLEVGKKRFDLS